ncbi:Uncharacterized protein conserved in archaea [Archaeoglobus sulfaticallidus PM70-1]|uniref:Uncharacterized protein conserved in archaea n=1 Tax=Archaeoglobus sulfaticallidus PM70-1 TaxID=387631 RepID=N0BCH6_9EURY|nr:DUF2202 domain-containing protein [Archaeoglobus sulfaticallidus]AGK60703.1 Uncharacterized protein conserved in archaea [Archaeoglobus sulfaticallidus PM70-1]
MKKFGKNIWIGLILIGMVLVLTSGCVQKTQETAPAETQTPTPVQTGMGNGIGVGHGVGQGQGAGQHGNSGMGNGNMGSMGSTIMANVETLPRQNLSQDEIDGIMYMREEEKLARDVYLALYDKWGLQIFSNIARSEQMHMDAVLALIKKYNLTDPAKDVGEFTNPHLQELYDNLVEQGSKSEVDALKVGALIEEVDIKDLKDWLAKNDNEDIELVYDNLMRGSENHLRAFTSVLKNYGVTYEPQVISEDEYQEIINAR